jgi:alkanesulfonate monooxygenase SsuD/methylene tetrahydromethanopterin reductase-like flavin-dependent oxidoreductase (luciferase family)
VKFSLLVEAQIADPTAATERQLFHDIVAQARLADELGYHAIWAVEHHGLYEYSHCSAPETLLAYIAACTTRIRLGHGVALTPGRYNHPIRVAERVATLDILSGGRVNWGSGKSASRTERNAFELVDADLDAQWREALEMIPRMWRSDVFEHRGVHYDIPPTAIVPKPVQQPHPPVYMACSRPESLDVAGALGVGALNFAAGTDVQLTQAVARYRAAIATCPAPARRVTNQYCCTPAALVLDDDREAAAHGFRGARYHQEGLAAYFFSPSLAPGALDISRDPIGEDSLSRLMSERGAESGPLNTVIGDPVRARESVARFAACGVDELILIMQMGTVPHDVVMRSLRTFGEKVMPHFA